MSNLKKSAPVLTSDQVKALDKMTTKSEKIRYLYASGMSKGDIARTLNIIYQHVRNVLITPIKSK
jgi:DNA-binding NarL/FixJ family response regulator